jgi:hypothetical protein
LVIAEVNIDFGPLPAARKFATAGVGMIFLYFKDNYCRTLYVTVFTGELITLILNYIS